MNLGYEYSYLFGLDINLKEFGLGVIKQPKIIDFISKDVDIEDFYMPFVANDLIKNNSDDKDVIDELINAYGGLKFFITTSFNAEKSEYVESLLKRISFLYNDKVVLMSDFTIRVGDKISITNDNFDKLCDVVLEMLKIDKSSLIIKKEDDEFLTDKMMEAKRKFLERQNAKKSKAKDDALGFADILNLLIHMSGVDYDKVSNMTVYQVRNSFNAMSNKEISNVSLLHRISPKFEVKKEDKLVLWTENLKIDKSTLSLKD